MDFGDILGSIGSFFTGGPLAAGLNLVSGFMTNESNKDIAASNNATSIELANTQYQRRVKDLAAAGLNPMLAYTQGGAAVPNLQQARMENPVPAASQALLNNALVAKASADTKVSESQAALNAVTAGKVAADTRLTTANAQSAEIETQRKEFLKAAGEFMVQGKELDAREAKALTDRMRESVDYNTQQYLLDVAAKHGYRTFDEAMADVKFRQALGESILTRLEQPKAEALAHFFSTPWGRDIAPFLSSANSAVEFLGAGKSLLSTGKRILGLPPGRR